MKRLRSALWLVVQFAALGCVLFSPLWLQSKSEGTPVKPGAISNVLHGYGATLSSPFQTPQTITSRILPLSPPDRLTAKARLLTVETAQVRFEWNEQRVQRSGSATPLRVSARDNASVWSLVKIERKAGAGNWESLSLIAGEAAQAVGSTFVELQVGMNDFRVSFADAQGEVSAYPLRVRLASGATALRPSRDAHSKDVAQSHFRYGSRQSIRPL